MPATSSPRPPSIDKKFPLPMGAGLLCMLAVMVALPVSQWVAGWGEQKQPPVVDTFGYERPPDVPEPPKPDEVQPADVPEFEAPPPRLTLTDMEIALNPPDVRGLIRADVVIPGAASGIGDLIHEIGDLTRPPRPISRVQPAFPAALKAARIEGEVFLEFVVRDDGRTSDYKVLRSTNPEFSEAAIRGVRKWVFEPGEKDGRAVHTRVRIQIPFTIR